MEPGIHLREASDHGQTMRRIGDRHLSLQRLPTGRDQDEPIERELLDRAVRQEEMADVRGIEGPAEDAEALPHRVYGRGGRVADDGMPSVAVGSLQRRSTSRSFG